MTRREFMRAVGATMALVALPVPRPRPEEPMGLLGLVDDATYAPWVYARSTVDAVTRAAMRTSPLSFRRWLEFEQANLELEASAQFGRPIRFEVIDEDGAQIRRNVGEDTYSVLWREDMTDHPEWRTWRP